MDEIDQIMNEIEELQKGMNPPKQAAEAPAHLSPAASAVSSDDAMAEFQAGRGETSMEETLSSLKDDEPAGHNLIDQALEAEAAAVAAATSAGLSEDEEIEAAIAQAEAEALAAAAAAPEPKAEAVSADLMIEEIQEPVMSRDSQRRSSRVSTGPASAEVALTLAGDMNLKVTYEFEGQEVRIGFTDGALQVTLSDGTEFKIPVRRGGLKKVA
jgi:CheY-like chemotaxis protein